MAASDKKINAFIFLYVVLPLFVVLALVNASMFNSVFTTKSDEIISLRKDATTRVRSEVNSSVEIVKTIGYLPEILAIIDTESDASAKLREKEWTFETWWDQLVKGQTGSNQGQAKLDPQLIINNDITKALARVKKSHPEIGSFLITDNLGSVIASSHVPDTTSVRSREWWREAFREQGKPYFEGMTPDGTITVNYAIWGAGDSAAPIGMARVDIKMQAIVDRIPPESVTEKSAIVVMSSEENRGYFTAGDKETISGFAAATVETISKTGRELGWSKNIHYSRDVETVLPLSKPYRVMAIKEGGLINLNKYVPVGITSLVSLVGLCLVSLLARRTGGTLNRDNHEKIQAGNWILHRMRGDSIKEASGSKVSKDLESWMSDFRRSIADNVEVQEYESKRELHLAREFQLSYMDRPYPRIPEVHVPGRLKLNFYHYYKPAMALGGDFFEIMKLGPETGGVVIADVMGHGTRSALITSNLRSIMNELKSQGRNARNYMREMNREFCQLLSHIELAHPIFASAFYFVADTVARSATFSTAGHPAPFHLKRSLNHVERLQVASPHGAALGIVKDEDYTGGSCRLTDGDVFIFFTDGVYEAFNGHGEEFGLTRLDRTIRKLMHNSMEGIVDGIIQEVNDFTAGEPLRDDICLFAIEVTGE